MPGWLVVPRIVVGLMCVAFAHFLGRSIAKRQKPAKRSLGSPSWALRTLLAGVAVTWQVGVDLLAGVVFGLAVLAAALGFYLERRPKRLAEDLSKEIFPD